MGSSNCPAVGGHACSKDGHHWRYTSAAVYNTTVKYEDGSQVTFARRERPELLFDEKTGRPTHLVTGVVEQGGGGMNDRSFTLVQPIGGGGRSLKIAKIMTRSGQPNAPPCSFALSPI